MIWQQLPEHQNKTQHQPAQYSYPNSERNTLSDQVPQATVWIQNSTKNSHKTMGRIFAVVVVLFLSLDHALGFSPYAKTTYRPRRLSTKTTLSSNPGESEEKVKLGSKEYYSGFVSRDLNEDPQERVTGDAVLIPTLKFVGGFTVVIGGLLLVFLASNGLL